MTFCKQFPIFICWPLALKRWHSWQTSLLVECLLKGMLRSHKLKLSKCLCLGYPSKGASDTVSVSALFLLVWPYAYIFGIMLVVVHRFVYQVNSAAVFDI